MNKFWLRNIVFFSLGLIPILGLYLLLTSQEIQPLLTDSISFDAKAQIMREMPESHIDVLGVGSSIALNNLGSKALHEYLGDEYTYFNAASWGLTMREVRTMLPGLLKKYQPKVILLASGPMDFEASKINVCSEKEFSRYILGDYDFYYYLRNTDLFTMLQRSKQKQDLTLHASLTDRQHLLFDDWGGINLVTSRENFHHHRFDKSLIKITEDFQYEQLEELLEIVQTAGSKLIFTSTPMKKVPNCVTPACQNFIKKHHQRVREIVEKNQQIYLDLHSTHQFPDSLFCDESHLVYEGPNQLSAEIAQQVALLDLLKANSPSFGSKEEQ